MSSYPPPPPGQYPPVYDRRALRHQRRLLRDQARAQAAQQRELRHSIQAQQRMRARSLQRRSIVGPLMLLALGVVFLAAQAGEFSWAQCIAWYGRFWPAVLIAAGVVLLAEWAIDRQRTSGTERNRSLGGGTVALLIFLAFAGLAARSIEYGLNWRDHMLGNEYNRWDHLFGDRHDADSTLSSAILPSSSLLIRNPHGDVTVSGSSSDGQVHVSVHTQAYAWKNYDASQKIKALQPAFSSTHGVLTLNIRSIDGGQTDLTIQMPRSTPLTIEANRGDVTVNQMSAPVAISANDGDIDLSAINSSVTLHVSDDNAGVTLHSIHGPVSVQGHSGDIDISEITGDLTLQGDFFGSTDLRHINGNVRFTTIRTQFSAARIDDQFSVDKDSLDATALLGPVVLRTQDKNITLDRVQGSVNLSNSNGSVEVTAAAPLDAISVHNQNGSVDLGLPGNTGFQADAKTRNGDVENDFSLTPTESGELHSMSGAVHGGGPTVTVATTDGDVTLRRSTVQPLPRSAPATPPFTKTPQSNSKRVFGREPTAPAAPQPPSPPSQDGSF